eukprot:gene12361-15542_t
MPRVDIWDAEVAAKAATPMIGYPPGLEQKYSLGDSLGSGGFGSVRVAVQITTGNKFACKSIKKKLDIPSVSEDTLRQHIENIKREITVLHRLRGTLNVVHLEEVFEDEDYVHIVMELCSGGELAHAIGRRQYSEATAAKYMQGVLRTLAQCHHHRILHRDVKPGNFTLLHDGPDAPLKAIDFGLALLYRTRDLPMTKLGLEGTPWYMSPEMLSSETGPPSDVWAAGVMTYQLLSGNFPFNDWKNPKRPALSLVWRSILTETPKMSGSAWETITEPAKDFVRACLDNPRSACPPLDPPTKKLQKFGTESYLKRTVLDMIANELLRSHSQSTLEGSSPQKMLMGRKGSPASGGMPRRPSQAQMAANNLIWRIAQKSATVHSGNAALQTLHGTSPPKPPIVIRLPRHRTTGDGSMQGPVGGSLHGTRSGSLHGPMSSSMHGPTNASFQMSPSITKLMGGSLHGLGSRVQDAGKGGGLGLPLSKTMSKIASQEALAHYAFLVGAGATAASVNGMLTVDGA